MRDARVSGDGVRDEIDDASRVSLRPGVRRAEAQAREGFAVHAHEHVQLHERELLALVQGEGEGVDHAQELDLARRARGVAGHVPEPLVRLGAALGREPQARTLRARDFVVVNRPHLPVSPVERGRARPDEGRRARAVRLHREAREHRVAGANALHRARESPNLPAGAPPRGWGVRGGGEAPGVNESSPRAAPNPTPSRARAIFKAPPGFRYFFLVPLLTDNNKQNKWRRSRRPRITARRRSRRPTRRLARCPATATRATSPGTSAWARTAGTCTASRVSSRAAGTSSRNPRGISASAPRTRRSGGRCASHAASAPASSRRSGARA